MLKKLYILTLIMTTAWWATAQNEAELVRNTIKKSTIKGHIYFLASDELAGRETGTHSIDVAARYLATTFMRYGVAEVPGASEGYFQNVPLVKIIPPSAFALQLGENAVDPENLQRISGSGIDLGGDIVFLDYAEEGDFEGTDVKGKIVIALAGDKESQDLRAVFSANRGKSQRAMEAGAVGVVELFTGKTKVWNQLSGYIGNSSIAIKREQEKEDDFFSLMINDPDEDWQKKLKSKTKQQLQITIGEAMNLPIPSKNVVGMVEGTDPDLKNEFVIYSAHYDHLGIGQPSAKGDSIYNGARDNAVGVVTVMSAAESIAKNPTKRSALFILFTAEEKGLLGSSYYVDNPLLPLEQMVYCFNSDNGGYNDTSLATIIGLERTTAGKHIKKAAETFGLKAIDDPAGEQGLFDRSDNVNFAKKGIPAPTFSLGFTAFDSEIGKYYHQQADNPQSIDYDYMERFFRAFVLSARLIANDEETPFWTEGDKYYEAGQELYSDK